MNQYTEAYGELRGRVCELVRAASRDQLDALAPATPEWRVRDIVAHLSGVCADVVNGNVEGVGSDAWTEKQVADRRDLPIEELLADWEAQSSAAAAMVGGFPDVISGQWVTDGVTHEHDIRGGLGSPGARDSTAVDIACRWGATVMDSSPPLRLETEVGPLSVGDGEPVATVRASRFELIRSMTGRRSLDQIRGYGWEGEPRPEQLLLLIFTPRATPLVE